MNALPRYEVKRSDGRVVSVSVPCDCQGEVGDGRILHNAGCPNGPTLFRFNARCRRCFITTTTLAGATGDFKKNHHGSTARIFRDEKGNERLAWAGSDREIIIPCRECDRGVIARRVEGKYKADKKCDGRCTSALGHNCECSCGGKNHGAGNVGEVSR
jgi:hypothetical protein